MAKSMAMEIPLETRAAALLSMQTNSMLLSKTPPVVCVLVRMILY